MAQSKSFSMRKIAIILHGSPGSGKGTQAELLARIYGLVHVDTGRFLESVVHDPARQKEAVVKRERHLFDTGILMTPSFVIKEVEKATARISKSGLGVVFSGSPRTMYEAERLIPILEKLYGKKNIFFVIFTLPQKVALERNVHRVLCSVCRSPLLTAYYPDHGARAKHCPVCAGPFYKRTLDTAETMKVRIKEYEERTMPIFSFVKKAGYRPMEFSAVPAPYKVFADMVKEIDRTNVNKK